MKKFKDQFAPLLPNIKYLGEEILVNGEVVIQQAEMFGGLYEEAAKERGLSFEVDQAKYVVRGDTKKSLGLYFGEIWDSKPMLIQIRDSMPMFRKEIANG